MQQEEIRKRLVEIRHSMCAITRRRQALLRELNTVQGEFYYLHEEKEKLERKLVQVRRVPTPGTVSSRAVATTMPDLATFLAQLTLQEAQKLLEELQGCEEQGVLLEYKDEPDTHEISECVGSEYET